MTEWYVVLKLEMMESFVSAVQQVEEHRDRVLDQRR